MPIKPWQTLSRKDVLVHPRMHLVEDEVRLPNGKTTQYIRHAPTKVHGVALIVINDKDELLVQKEYNLPPDKVMWQLPGGGGNEGEDIIESAKRELIEESNLTANDCTIIGSYYADNRRSDIQVYVVLCKDLRPQTGQSDPEEFIETHWIPVKDIPCMLANGEFENIYLLGAFSIWLARAGKIS